MRTYLLAILLGILHPGCVDATIEEQPSEAAQSATASEDDAPSHPGPIYPGYPGDIGPCLSCHPGGVPIDPIDPHWPKGPDPTKPPPPMPPGNGPAYCSNCHAIDPNAPPLPPRPRPMPMPPPNPDLVLLGE